MFARRVAALMALLAGVTGCAADEPPASPGPALRVQAFDNAFSPVETDITPGTKVIWVNRGRNEHDIIPEDAAAEWRFLEGEFGPGDTVDHTFPESGEFRYYCSIHGSLTVGMPGVINVD